MSLVDRSFDSDGTCFPSGPRQVQNRRAVLPGSLRAQTVFLLARHGRCTSDFALPGWEATGWHNWAGVGR